MRPWYLRPPRSKTTASIAGRLGALGDQRADSRGGLALVAVSAAQVASSVEADASVWPLVSSTTCA